MTSHHHMKYRIGQTEYTVAIKDIDAIGTGNLNIVDITQSDYNALSEEEKNDTSKLYVITDADVELNNVDTTPIGIILPYVSNRELPIGFLVCDGSAVSRTMYPDLFQAIGTTFGEGDGETTFNLPDLSDRVLQGASETNPVGTYKEAGLPNIEGTGNTYITYRQPTGAMYADGSASVVGSSGLGVSFMNFDASRSNPIYGNSNTVQPPALTVQYIIKAFNGIANNPALLDITQMANTLNKKIGEHELYEENFVIIYPNGGTAENPANVTKTSSYIENNPFPGYIVDMKPEIFYDNRWQSVNWVSYSASSIYGNGISCYQKDDSIIVVTGNGGVSTGGTGYSYSITGVLWDTGSGDMNTAPCRVKVWKVGKISDTNN